MGEKPVEEDFKERMREAKKNGELDEAVHGLCYEVGHAHGRSDGEFTDVGWKNVMDWKEEVQDQ